MAAMTAPDVLSASQAAAPRRFQRSLVIPVYRNEENLPSLLAALETMDRQLGGGLEVICVVDGSPDRCAELLIDAAERLPFALRVICHSRNFGSFTAIRTGMEFASGDAIAVMAADLQEPPELVVSFFSILEAREAEVVFGQREGRHDAFVRDALSNLFWSTYRRFVIPDVPRGGVDMFAVSRTAAEAVLRIEEPNSSLVAQLFWIGFRRRFVPYTRRKREHGASAWGFARRMRYMMDSIFSFSDWPILFVMWFGIAGCALSFLFGATILMLRLFGVIQVPGYAGLAALIAFSGSASLAVQGVLGSYLWRTFENTKRRPLRIVARIHDNGLFMGDRQS